MNPVLGFGLLVSDGLGAWPQPHKNEQLISHLLLQRQFATIHLQSDDLPVFK